MSVAWMAPVPVWNEPAKASAIRVGVRVAFAVGWAIAALTVPWLVLAIPLWLFCAVALTHAGIAVGNLVRNRGVLLRLMGTGTLEWPRSLQEEWLKKSADWVDGPVIEVVEIPSPQVSLPTGPHVNLVGPTRTISRLPLYGVAPRVFIDTVNTVTVPRGVTLVPEGSAGRGDVRAPKAPPEA